MSPALEVVYNTLIPLLPDYFCYYKQNQIISEESTYDIVSQSVGTDLILGDYVEYIIESEESLGVILTDRKISLTDKYQVTVNNTYSGIKIIKHTSNATQDILWVTGVPTYIHPSTVIEDATFLSLKLVQSVFFSSEPMTISMTPPHKCLFGGEAVSISIATKYDEDKTNLSECVNTIISYIMTHHRKFDIIDALGNKVGYYKLTGLPQISNTHEDGINVQMSTIYLEGFYLLRY